jgi:3',5'-cyclic AMP phosphodiesterase CpdA
MTRILHISDLHFGPPAVLEHIDAVNAAIDAGICDVVAISGDFSQRSKAGEFQRAAVFLREAGKQHPTISVPGNHDVAWWYAPVKVGHYDRLYENYRRYISPELEPTLDVDGVSFVGINTSHGITPRTLTWNMRDLSIIGDVTPAQLASTRAKLECVPAGNLKTVVMHHNPVAGRLSQRYGLKHPDDVLRTLAEMGVELVLCGHDHEEQVSAVRYGDRQIIVSTAGTVSDRSRGGRASSFHLITVTPSSVEVEVWPWSVERGDFVPGERKCFAR